MTIKTSNKKKESKMQENTTACGTPDPAPACGTPDPE